MTETELLRERDGLIGELTRIDAKREQLKAEIVRENRLPGVSKQRIALKQTERADLLHAREDMRRKIAGVNEQIKELRRQFHGGAVPETEAQRFVEIARRSLPQEMFHDLMDRARELAGWEQRSEAIMPGAGSRAHQPWRA
jgi:cobalamin biosynthesis protein CobT